MKQRKVSEREVRDHFFARAERYNRSSHWVEEQSMGEAVRGWLGPKPQDLLLDVACGTGRWAQTFSGSVGTIIGVDMVPEMYSQGRPYVDHLVHARGEHLPFRDDLFDIVTERQGIQFMDTAAVVREMVRVTRPGGRICLVQLCAYGPEDKDEYFEILALRNPARRNFFLRQDLAGLLKDAGCSKVDVRDHISEEDVGRWADNGAILDDRQTRIREIYDRASDAFRARHAVESRDGGYVDQMLFGVAIGVK